jgi:caffeoyl-CoA O-methyltransferase
MEAAAVSAHRRRGQRPAPEATMIRTRALATGLGAVIAFTAISSSLAQVPTPDGIDRRVEALLAKMQNRWRDMNVPEQDGKLLHEIILKNKYRRVLEVGTSTGHSGVWMAWALSRTGGRLITLEIDERRHREAVANFREAGLDPFIDARLGDAHELVKALPGPFDFVFIDADKDWNIAYAKELMPKLEAGGCLAVHNVRAPRSGGGRGWGMGADYYEFISSQPGYTTSVHPESVGGLALSYKKGKP